jgi:hypothetical protein
MGGDSSASSVRPRRPSHAQQPLNLLLPCDGFIRLVRDLQLDVCGALATGGRGGARGAGRLSERQLVELFLAAAQSRGLHLTRCSGGASRLTATSSPARTHLSYGQFLEVLGRLALRLALPSPSVASKALAPPPVLCLQSLLQSLVGALDASGGRDSVAAGSACVDLARARRANGSAAVSSSGLSVSAGGRGGGTLLLTLLESRRGTCAAGARARGPRPGQANRALGGTRWRRPTGEAKAMHLSYHGVTGDPAAQLFSDLTCGQPFSPQGPQRVDAFIRPAHRTSPSAFDPAPFLTLGKAYI